MITCQCTKCSDDYTEHKCVLIVDIGKRPPFLCPWEYDRQGNKVEVISEPEEHADWKEIK